MSFCVKELTVNPPEGIVAGMSYIQLCFFLNFIINNLSQKEKNQAIDKARN